MSLVIIRKRDLGSGPHTPLPIFTRIESRMASSVSEQDEPNYTL